MKSSRKLLLAILHRGGEGGKESKGEGRAGLVKAVF